MTPSPFSYDAAFSRNLGWTTEWEQSALRAKRVAIAGMGGVGGIHLITLARLGIGGFNIADFDRFDVANLNRQAGAMQSTLGRPKVDVLAEMARDVNPELRLHLFRTGVTPDNVDAFLAGCDLFVDGLDFFALDIRSRVFARCYDLGIPAVTAAPIGMGVGFLAFLPGGMSFEQYFRLAGQTPEDQALRFLLGVAPRGLHRAYLADDTRVDLAAKAGPSTAAACSLCAGVVATQALKILLHRGGVPAAPVHVHFDAYRFRARQTRLDWGNAGPMQRIKLSLGRRFYRAIAAKPARAPAPALPESPLLEVLDAARWAPSGDNLQPWRFELTGPDRLIVHVVPEPATNPYEFRDGEPTLLSVGMLLESLRVAASAHARDVEWQVLPGDGPVRIAVSLPSRPEMMPDSLCASLPMRSVARGGMGRRPLTPSDKQQLAEALGAGLTVTWHEKLRQRWRFARLGAAATDIRLRAAETFAVHRRIVDWAHPRSPHGLPAGSIGLNRPTLAAMRWGMQDWSRMERLNRLMGTAGAAVQLDLAPAINSAAMFVIRGAVPHGSSRVSAVLQQGVRIQRFWLTATALGLAVQPALATLMLAHHGEHGTKFTADERLLQKAKALSVLVRAELGDLDGIRFLGRIGQQRPGLPGPRSVRKPLAELLVYPAAAIRATSASDHNDPAPVMNDQTTGCSSRMRPSTVPIAPTVG